MSVIGWVLAAGCGWAALVWAMSTLTGRFSGWLRLAELYPDRNVGRGRSFRTGPVVMGRSGYRVGLRLTPEDSHLHVSLSLLLRLGHRPFSVPWSDITASPDEWPWIPLRGDPVVRLTLARYRELRILVPRSDGERILAASGGRLRMSEQRR